MSSLSTRDQIKRAARRLFAQRGIAGVTVREIVAASEQKNSGSLHYYFRTKDALVRELIVDTARLIDDRRNVALDALEAAGGPRDLRQVLEVLVFPSIHLGEGGEDGAGEGDEGTYLRFISLLALQDRPLLDEVVEDGLNSGYQRCLAHVRHLVTDVEPVLLEQRLVFMSIALRAILAAREASLERAGTSHPFWTDAALAELVDSLANMVSST